MSLPYPPHHGPFHVANAELIGLSIYAERSLTRIITIIEDQVKRHPEIGGKGIVTEAKELLAAVRRVKTAMDTFAYLNYGRENFCDNVAKQETMISDLIKNISPKRTTGLFGRN